MPGVPERLFYLTAAASLAAVYMAAGSGKTTAAAAAAFGAVLTDVRTGRISNRWLVLCSVFYLLFSDAPAEYLLRTVLCIAVLLPLYLIRVLGAGDVKLLAVLAGMLGGGTFLPLLFRTFLFAAMLSAALFAAVGGIRVRLREAAAWAAGSLAAVRNASVCRSPADLRRVPYPKEEWAKLHLSVPAMMAVMTFACGRQL